MIYIYDPKTNVSTPTTYEYLAELTGKSIGVLMSAKSRGTRLRSLGCRIIDDDTPLDNRRKWYGQIKYNDEAWATINGSDDKFIISNYGRVKRIYKTGEKLLLPFRRKGKGNLLVKCKYQGKYGEHKIGHLVAAHFIREPITGERLVRKNGIITDDYVLNLEYVTTKELGKKTGYKSKSKPVVQVDLKTHEVINEFRSAREAGRQCNFSYQAILDRCNGKYPYKHDDVTFMFEDDYEKSMTSSLTFIGK